MTQLQEKVSKFEVKESNDDARTIKGYASVFGNEDSDKDIIHKGAFTRSIKSWGPEGKDRIKLIAQHNINRPVARITELKEDGNGLYIEAKFGTHTDGDDYYRMAKEGLINEFSVGFVAIKKTENELGGFDITEIKLYEVSMVTVAANDEAVVTDVKSLTPFGLIKQIKDEELAHKLEHEFLKVISQRGTTQPESDLAVKEDSLGSDAENYNDFVTQLNKSYTNGK